MTVVLVSRGEHFAVDVELNLCGSRVANPYWPRRTVAIEVHRSLSQAMSAGDTVKNLRCLMIRAADRAFHPMDEVSRFLLESDRHHRVEHQRRIAQPREAIIPVTLTADGLR